MVRNYKKLPPVKDLPLLGKADRIVRRLQIESRNHDASLTANRILQTPNRKAKEISNAAAERAILLALMRAMRKSPAAVRQLNAAMKRKRDQ